MNTPPRTTRDNNMPPPTLRNIRSREIQPSNIPFPDLVGSPDMGTPPVGIPPVTNVSNNEIQGINSDLTNYLHSNNNNDDKIKRIIKSNYNKATKRYLLENYTDNTYNPSDAELDGYNIVGGKRQFKKTKSKRRNFKKTKSRRRNLKKRKSKKTK
jgi:hypothetical protein